MKFNQEYADLLSSGNDICIDNQLATGAQGFQASGSREPDIHEMCCFQCKWHPVFSSERSLLKIPKDCHTYLQSWWRCTVEYTANCLMYREQAIARLIGFEHWQRLCLECRNPPNGKNNFWLAFQLCTCGIPTVGRRHLAWRGMILKLIDTVPCFDQILCLFGYHARHSIPPPASMPLTIFVWPPPRSIPGPYWFPNPTILNLPPDTRHQTPDTRPHTWLLLDPSWRKHSPSPLSPLSWKRKVVSNWESDL